MVLVRGSLDTTLVHFKGSALNPSGSHRAVGPDEFIEGKGVFENHLHRTKELEQFW
jgi:hypothetical protein